MSNTLENFIEAFRENSCGATRYCECGKFYFNPDRSWGWNDGELEGYLADPKCIGIDDSISAIVLDNKEYATCCNCWHERAKEIIALVTQNRRSIGRFFELEVQRIRSVADSFPTIK